MKTKLTFLLALVSASTLHAEKPGFNGPRASANVPAAPSRSVPSAGGGSSSGGGGSSSRVNGGQILGIARTVLPLIQSMNAPRQAAPPPPKQNRPVVVKKPAAVKQPAVSRPAAIPSKATAPRSTPDARLGGLSGQQAAGIREGMNVAEGLRSLNDLLNTMPEGMRENLGFGNRPAGPGKPNLDLESGGNYQERELNNPLDRNKPGSGLTNIRRGASNSRQATPASRDQMSRTAGRVFDSASRLTFGSGSSSTGGTPVYREDEGTGDIVVEQRGTDANGQPAAVVVIEYGAGSGQTLGTKELVYHSNEHGKQVIDVVTRDPEGNVISSGTTEACGLDPETAASLGGPIGPTVQDVTGLTDLDLLRQFANGEAPRGGGNYMTRPNNAVQVLPPAPDGTTRGGPRVKTIDILNPGPGGDIPNLGEH